MRRLNKTLAGLMAAVMVLLGVSVTPAVADAEAPTTVYYDIDQEFAIADYWKAENPAAPVKDGYVFSGWYAPDENNTYTPIKQEDIEENGVDTYSAAVAKFVPSYVLSVKMQINSTTQTENGTLPFAREKDGVQYTNMRLLSAVDSVKYQNVGFDIVLDKTGKELELNYTQVYRELGADEHTGKTKIVAKETFGSPATHFIAAELSNIVEKNLTKIIYVTPYWTTIDGTKVEGASKYIRVMDGYDSNRFISIPVNVLTNVDAAAGMVEMEYDSTTVTVHSWEPGLLYTEMKANTETAGTIKFVGNGADVDSTYMTGEDIYANVWFKVTGSETIPTNSLEFTMVKESFCRWDEVLFVDKDGESTVKVRDVLY